MQDARSLCGTLDMIVLADSRNGRDLDGKHSHLAEYCKDNIAHSRAELEVLLGCIWREDYNLARANVLADVWHVLDIYLYVSDILDV